MWQDSIVLFVVQRIHLRLFDVLREYAVRPPRPGMENDLRTYTV